MLGFGMALNIRPLYSIHYPFMHPLPSIPDELPSIKPSTYHQPEREKRDRTKSEIMDRKVKKRIQDGLLNKKKMLNLV